MKRHSLALAAVLSVCAPALAQRQFLLNDRDLDAIMRLIDLDLDGMVNGPCEVATWFAAGNLPGTLGPMNPNTIAVRPSDGLTLVGDQINRNVYLLRDENADGDAMDRSESTVVADVPDFVTALLAQ